MEEDMCNVLQQQIHLCLPFPFYASLAGALKHVCLTTMCRIWIDLERLGKVIFDL